MEDAAVSAVPCALVGAWLPCVGVAFTGRQRPLPKTKYLPRYRSVRCHPKQNLNQRKEKIKKLFFKKLHHLIVMVLMKLKLLK